MTRRILATALAALLSTGLALAKDDGGFEQTLEVGSAVDLRVETDAGGITVHTGEDGEVRVVARIKRQRRWMNMAGMDKVRAVEQNPPIEHEGSTVRIGLMVRDVDQKGLSIGYEIWTPRNTKLTSECDSGGQRIEGITGPVNAKCDSGGIRVRDIGGDVNVEVDSGRIEADGIDGNLIAAADSGGIEAKGVRGSVDANADSGGIEIEQIAPADITAVADSGGIRVWIPSTGSYTLSAESDSGGIKVEPEMTVTGTIKKDRVQGKIRGGGNTLNLSTDSGGIRIYDGSGEM
jgi:putative adhesin